LLESKLESSGDSELAVDSVLSSQGELEVVVELALNNSSVGEFLLSTNSDGGFNNDSLVLDFSSNLGGSIVLVVTS
jgi:hypothetical protein